MKSLAPDQSARLAILKLANEAHNKAWQKYASFPRGPKGGSSASIEQQTKINAEGPFSNDERAELETLLFISTPHQKEFVYPNGAPIDRLTGFMGNKLMTVTYLGTVYRSCLGDKRQSVKAIGINGCRYHGIIYGTYARMTPSKVQPV